MTREKNPEEKIKSWRGLGVVLVGGGNSSRACHDNSELTMSISEVEVALESYDIMCAYPFSAFGFINGLLFG